MGGRKNGAGRPVSHHGVSEPPVGLELLASHPHHLADIGRLSHDRRASHPIFGVEHTAAGLTWSFPISAATVSGVSVPEAKRHRAQGKFFQQPKTLS